MHHSIYLTRNPICCDTRRPPKSTNDNHFQGSNLFSPRLYLRNVDRTWIDRTESKTRYTGLRSNIRVVGLPLQSVVPTVTRYCVILFVFVERRRRYAEE